MSKILITGASGFVGSFLVEEALKTGLEVYAGMRSTSSRKWLKDPRINFIELDLSDTDLLTSAMMKHQFDYVIHNAGLTKGRTINDYYVVNADFTHNLARANAKNTRLKKFSFMSSLAAYGPADHQPDQVLSLSSKPNPVTSYGRSKLRAEKFIQDLGDLPYLIFRPTGVFGPRETDFFTLFQAVNRGVAPRIGWSEQWLSLIYVKDLVHIIMKATLSDVDQKSYFVTDGNLYAASKFNRIVAESLDKKPFNIKVPLPAVYLIASINEAYSNLTGKSTILNKDKYAELKARNLDCDISDLVQDFDFLPKYDLKSAVNETTQWYQENNWL